MRAHAVPANRMKHEKLKHHKPGRRTKDNARAQGGQSLAPSQTALKAQRGDEGKNINGCSQQADRNGGDFGPAAVENLTATGLQSAAGQPSALQSGREQVKGNSQ